MILLVARALFVSSLAVMCFWLLYAGTKFDRIFWWLSKIPNIHGCSDVIVSPVCGMQKLFYSNLLFLWLTPAVMALSAIVILAVKPVNKVKQFEGGEHHWTSHLLPPRWVQRAVLVLQRMRIT